MTYRDRQGRKIQIRGTIGGWVAKRLDKDGHWRFWNFETTYCPCQAEAQRRLDALAVVKKLTPEGPPEATGCPRSDGGPVSDTQAAETARKGKVGHA